MANRPPHSHKQDLDFEALEPRILFDAAAADAPVAEVQVNVVEEEFINEDVNFEISFDNTGGSEGYAPYVDFVAPPELEINSVETFGAPAENPDGPATTAIGQIAADGQLVDLATGTTPIDHPMYANPSDAGTYGLAGSGTPPVTYDVATNPALIGMHVYSVQLPFGSFTEANPAASVQVSASLDKANGIIPHQEVVAYAQGGFAYGCDALHNPGADTPIASGLSSDGVTPLVIDLEKTAGVPEEDGAYTGENASGPNHPITYTLTVNLADGEEVDNLVIEDFLPDDLAYTGSLSVSFGAGTGGTKVDTIVDQPAVNTDGLTAVDPADNRIRITVDNIIGTGGGDITVTYTTFVPYQEFDGTLVVDPVTGQEGDLDPNEYNDASVIADYDADGAGPGASVVIGDDEGPMDPSPTYESFSDDTDYRIEEHSIATQKGVGILAAGDRGVVGTLNSGDVVEYSIDFQISDYFAFTDVVFDDTMSDGQEFLPALDTFSVDPASVAVDPGNTITIAGHGLGTADELTYLQAPTAIGGLATGTTYYAIAVDTDTIKLATSAANATAGTAISLTSQGTGPHLFTPSSWTNAADFEVDPVQARPEFTFTMHGSTVTLSFDEANFSATEQADGTTDIQFDLYQQLVDDGFITAGAPLLGGFIETTGTAAADLGPTNFNGGATTGTITYRALVRDAYQAGDQQEISQGDALDNTVTVTGMNRDIETFAAIQNVSDGSGSSIGIPVGSVIKETVHLYSHGQMIPLVDDNDPTTRPVVAVTPGDLVTYRIQYQLPISEFEDLTFQDFVPLPIFDIDGAGTLAIDTTQIYDYDATDSFQTPGRISFGPGDTFFGPDGPGGTSGIEFTYPGYNSTASMTPTISIIGDGELNAFEVDLGSYHVGAGNDPIPTMVELLVTLEVQDGEFAEGLFFTNQVLGSESNTSGSPSSSNEISQSVLERPNLAITKGVTAVTHNDGVFSTALGPASVTFNAPGSGSAWSGGPITSDALAGTPIDANLSNIDAGDLVTFFVVVENTGISQWGAFDVAVTETIPAGMAIPGSGANLRVTLGDGTVLNSGTGYTGDLFTTPLELVDPAIDQGSLEIYNGSSGRNLVIIAYDLVVEDTVDALELLTNVAEVESYAAREGGLDYAEPGELTDDATVQVASPAVDKTIVDTSHDDTDNLDWIGEVAIGEVVTYSVTFDIPEGEMSDVRVLDTLPAGMAFVGLDSITASAGLSVDVGGTPYDLNTDSRAYYNASASTLELGIAAAGVAGFDKIINSDTDNLVTEQITIVYRAVVLNDSNANRDDVKANDAEIRWTPPQGEQVVEDSENVIVIEPDVTVDKSIVGGVTSVEGADLVTYRIVVTNNNVGANSAEAYDVVLADALPADVSYSAASLTNTAGVAPNVGTLLFDGGSGPEGTIRAQWDRLGVGESSTIEVTVRIDDGLNTDTVITNDADIEYTSLPESQGDAGYTGFDPLSDFGPNANTGTNPALTLGVERTGDPTDPGGAVNIYNDTDPASVTVTNPLGIDKAIIDTAEVHTSQDNTAAGAVTAAIGEVVRYEIRVRLPQATSQNIQLVDTLDSRLFWIDEFSNDMDIRLEGFSNPANFVASNPLIPAADGSTYALDPSLVGFNGATNEVSFNLGDLTNNETDAGDEFIVIAYNAIVRNDANPANRGDVLSNSVQLFEQGAAVNPPMTVDLTVVEPVLGITKSDASTTTADAGDLIDYTITVTSQNIANTTTAFEVGVTDSVPDELEIVGGAINIVGLPGTSSVVTNTVVGQDITVLIDQLNPGEDFQITFQARVRDTGANIIHSDEYIENTASLWDSSLPGDGTDDGVGDNTTGNEAGIPGDPDGERQYDANASDDFTTPSPVLSKVLANPAITDFTIGETVEYVITLDVPEGRVGQPDAYILDNIDPGFRFVPGTLSVTLDAGVTAGIAGPYTEANAAFFTHTDPGDVLLAEELRFDFDYVDFNNTGALDGLNTGTIEIRYQLKVENVLGNQQGDQLNNTANFSYTDDNGTTTNVLADSTGDADTIIDVVEPNVTVTKSFTALAGTPDARDLVGYQVVVENTSALTAYDVTFRDEVPAGLVYQPLSFTATRDSDSGDVSAFFNATPAGLITDVAGSIDLAAGDKITIAYNVEIPIGVQDGNSFLNEADVEWTTLDGTDADERTGDGDLDNPAAPTNPNDYENEDTATFSADLTYGFSKEVFSTSAGHTNTAEGTSGTIEDLTIGETVTYRLVADIGRGTTDQVQIIDTLDITNGLLDITNVTVTGGAALSRSDGFAWDADVTISDAQGGDSYNDTVQIDFGTIVNDPNLSTGAGDEQIIVLIEALVVNEIANQQDDVINNEGELRFFEDTDGNGSQELQILRDDVDVEIVEPNVTVDKSIISVPADPNGGDTVSYRVEIRNTTGVDAFDLTFQDILPAQMDLQTGTFSALRDSDGFIVNGLFSVTADEVRQSGSGFDLAANDFITITYDAVILSTVTDGLNLINEADVEWTSLNDSVADGSDADERTGDGDPDIPAGAGNPNDYEDEDDATVVANLSPQYDFTKAILSTSAGHTTAATSGDPTIEDLTVGEQVTYVLTATIAEGTTPQVVISDTLDLANGVLDIRAVRVSGGSNLTTSAAASIAAVTPAISDSNGDSYDDSFTLDFDEVVNDASGTNPEDGQIRIEIDAVVVNVLANQGGDVITNTGELSFLEDTDGDGSADDVRTINDSVDVELVEPEVSVTKTIPAGTSQADAGDVVGYRIVVENTSDIDAFDLTFQDVIPAQVSIDTGSFTAQRSDLANVASFFTVTAGGITQAGSGFDLASGQSITIDYNATVLETVTDGLVLINEADIEWTSLDLETADGSDADERGGDGDFDNPAAPTNPNDYENEDTADITGELTPLYDFDKAIFSTSESHTGTAFGIDPSIEDLVIGEMVTYQLTAQMGRGTTPGVVIEDILNLTNGILDIRAVRVESGAAVSYSAPTPVVTDSNGDTYDDQVTINFGTVVNDPALSSGAAEDEQIRVFIDAVVVNILENQEGDVINNLGRLTVLEDTDGDGSADDTVVREDNVDVEIVEPAVTVTKSITAIPANPDAGDTVTYRIVIANSTDIDAFDLTFSDVLPTHLDLDLGSFTAQRSDLANVASFFTVTTDDINQAGSGFDLAANTTITIDYDATILSTVRDGDDLVNLTDVEWTSIDGANGDERGGDGDPDNPAGPTNPNDYEDESSQTFRADLDPVYAFTKVIESTSAGHTTAATSGDPSIEDLTIGEQVTYRLTATIGRGTTDQVRIVDTLDIANGRLDIRNVTVSAGAALSRSDGRAWDADVATTDSQGADGYDDTVTIDFFTVVNDASGTGADEQIVVLIEAVVVNDLENQGGDVINNAGELRYLEDTDEDGVQEQQTLSENVDVELVEPEVSVTKTIPAGTSQADAGDVVGYRIVVENTSDIDAFDLTFQDVIPAQVSIDTGSFTAQRSDLANVASFFTVTAGGITQAGSGFDLASGQSITIDYNATVLETVTDGLVLINEADIEWTSLDLETADGSDADERGGDGDFDNPAAPTNPNDYENEDTADITGELTPLYDFDKAIFSTSESHTGTAFGIDPSIEDLVIGEMVTYQLTAQMGRGTTPGVVIEDILNLTNGILDIRAVRVESGAAVSYSAPTPVVTDSNGDTYDDQVTINFGTVVNDPALSSGAAEDEQIRVFIDAVVVNILENQEGDVINNLGRLTVLEDTDGDGSADDTVVREDNVDVEIVEPAVTVTKSITAIPANPDAGDTVTYRIVIANSTDIDAFDLTFSDVLPTHLDLDLGSFTAQRSDLANVASFFTVTTDDINQAGSGFDLAANTTITIDYDATILSTVRDGDDLVNLTDVEWTSIDGANGDERGGDGDPDNPAGPTNPNDYEDESSQTFRADLDPIYAFTKVIESTSAGHTGTSEGTSGSIEDLVVGEQVTYRLTATIGRGTTDQVRIVDTLDIANGRLDIRNVTVSAGAALSRSDARAWDADVATTDSQGADTYADTVTIDFFTVVNDASGTGADEQIVVLIDAVVVNDLENQDGDVINNVGELRFLQDIDGDGTQEQQVLNDNVDVEVVEPEVTVTKVITSVPADPNAGDTVSYQVTLDNSSGIDAFDLTFQDVLPAEIDLQTGTFSATHQPSGFGVNSRFTWDADSIAHAGTGFDLADGESIVITYDAVILPTVTDGLNLINEADVEWTSLDDGTADGSDADERGGDGDFDNPAAPTNPDDYENEDDATVVANLSPQYAFTKVLDSTSAGHTTAADGTSPTIEDLTIGEQVTYVLTASIGEGTTPQVVISDTLDPANGVLDIRAVRVSGGSNLTTSAAASISAVAPTLQDLNGDTYTEGFILDFATVVNDATGTNPEDGQIRVEIDAVVVNVLENQDGDIVTNTGTLSFLEDVDNDGSADDLRQISDAVDVELVEPNVTVAKSIPAGTSQADAGDVVGYEIVVTNTADHTAFDVTFQDIVPAQMDIRTATFTATRDSDGGDVSGFFTVGTGDIAQAGSGFELVAGDFITITYDAEVLATVTDGLTLENEADIEWTTLDANSADGSDADERGGDGDFDNPAGATNPNDYEDEDTADITGELTPLYDFDKAIFSTSESHTGTAFGIDPSIEDLVIGEMVTYQLTAQMGRGTTPGVVIEDILALTNGILDIRAVRVESGAAVSYTVPTPVITDSNGDTYNDQVTINFGTVVNDPALSAGTADEQIRVFIDAVVVNILDNQEGDVINNFGRLTVLEDTDGDGSADDTVVREDDVDVEIVEPAVTVTKSITAIPANPDAGDTVTYRIVIANSTDIDAFDLTFSDVLPAELDLDVSSFTAQRSDFVDVASSFTVTADNILHAGSGFDLAANTSITIDYDAEILPTVRDGQDLVNLTDVEWTSIDGANGDERGGDGDPDNPAAPTNPNDYEDESSQTFRADLDAVYAFTKVIESTSAGHTTAATSGDPSIEDLTIGEQVTYRLTATIGRGTTDQVRIVDTLDIANGRLDIRNVTVSAGSALSRSDSRAWDADVATTDSQGADGYDDTVTIDFFTVVNDASGTGADEQIVVLIEAVVVNDLENQGGDVINNVGELRFLQDIDGDGTQEQQVLNDNVDVEVVEPEVTVAKSIPAGTTQADAGDVVGYQVVVTNTSDIDAFDVTFQDIVPAQVDIRTATFTATRDSDGGDVASFFTAGTDDIVQAGSGFDLASGDFITITYDAEVLATVTDGLVLTNEADIEWTTLDAESADGSDADERGGDGDFDNTAAPTNPNDYEDEDTATITGELSPLYDFDKAIFSTSESHTGTAFGTDPSIEDLVIGEMVTYQLTAQMGRGTTPGVVIEDILALTNGILDIRAVRVESGAAVSYTAPTPVITDSNGDTYGDQVTINFGTVVNDPTLSGGTTDEQIRVFIDAVVVNILDNQEGDVINNLGRLTVLEDTDGDGSADDTVVREDNVDVELVEPALAVNKTIPGGETEADAGDVIGYQVVVTNTSDIDAFDVTFQDIVPAQMDIRSATFTATRDSDGGDVSAFFTVGSDDIVHASSGFDLASGDFVTITYDAEVLATVTDGLVLTNEADIEWTSVDGTNADERGGDGDFDNPAGATNPNDYEDEDTATITGELSPLYDFDKSIFSTSESHTGTAFGTDPSIEDLVIGEMVTYQLTAQMGRGTTPGVVIEDILALTNGILDIRAVRVESGAAVSYTAPTPVITDSNGDTYGDQVTINFGTVVNDPALSGGTADEQIRVFIDAVVVNILDNQEGDLINNLGRLTVLEDTDGDGSADDAVVREDDVDVEIVEPAVTVTKTIETIPTDPDAGDTVSYRIVIANTTDIDAFDLTFSDVLPAELDLDLGSFSAQRSDFVDVASSFTVTADDILHAGSGFDLAANTTITIDYDATVLETVRDGQDLTNLTDVEWTSVDGTNADERGGDGDPDNPAAPTNPDDYEDDSEQTFRANLSPLYDFTKVIDSTSAAHTATVDGTSPTIEDLTIGEVVTYRLTGTLGRGTTDQVRIVDTLDIANGLLDIRNVTVTAGSALSRTDGFAWDANVSTSNAQGADSYNDTVTIDFFTVVNDASGTGADEQIVVLIDAVVVNDLENQDGDVINNAGEFRFLEDIDGDGVQEQQVLNDNVDVELVEPNVTVAKSIPAGTTQADAGDVVGYQIVLTNTADHTAFDVTFQDIVPAQMDIRSATFTATRDSDGGDVSSFFTVGSDDIVQAGSGFDLAAGDFITITYDAEVLATVTDGLVLTNEADIEWTSLDAESADGSDADERGGDGDFDNTAAPTNPNDYEDEDTATITGELSPLYDFDKAIFSTSESHTGTAFGTDPSIEDLVIGEMVTYQLTAQMGRGTTPGVVIEDILALTNGILDIRAVRVESGAAVSYTAPTPVITDSNGDTYGDQVTINFGTVVNDPTLSGGTTDEQIRVFIDAVVVNILDNQEGDVINNLGRLTVLEDTDGDGSADDTVVREDNVDVELVEPALAVNKTIPGGETEADAGDVIGYQIVISNTSDIDAFDVTFQDKLPDEMRVDTTSFTAVLDGTTNVVASFDPAGWGITEDAGRFDLAAGSSIVINYNAEVLATVTDGLSLENEADIEWTSVDGTNADERGGDGDFDNPASPTNPNDYENVDTAEITGELTPLYDFDKAIFSTSESHTGTAFGTSPTIEDLVVGEMVTYQLTAQMGRGTTPGVVIEDILNLTNGILDIRAVRVESGAAVSYTVPTPVITDSNGDTYGDQVTINFGTVVNDPTLSGGTADEQIRVFIDAVVVNILDNQEGDVINNLGRLTVLEDTDGDGSADDTVVREDNVDVEIVEPAVTVNKGVTSVPANPDAADIVSYAISLENTTDIDAFDITFIDDLPAEMRYAANLIATRVSDGADVTGFFTPDTGNTRILQSGSGFTLGARDRINITYDALITEDVLDGLILTNDVDAEWTSTPGTNGDERGGDGDPDNPAAASNPNDYETEDDASIEANLIGYGFDKTIFATSQSHTDASGGLDPSIEDLVIGETVTYALTATFAEGTTKGVIIEDDISRAEGLFNVESVSITGGANMSSTAGAFGSIPITIDDRNGDGHNEYVRIDFDSVINNAGDGVNPEADQITVYVTARVMNVIENQEGDVVRNDATFTFLEDQNGDNIIDGSDTPTELYDAENVEIIEPELNIDKSVNNRTPKLREVLTYTLVVSNEAGTSRTDAFDMVIDDKLANGLTFVPGSITLTNLGTPPNPSSIVSNNSTGNKILLEIDRLDEGESFEITYQARVTDDPSFFMAVLPNEADLTWTSTPGTTPEERVGDPSSDDPTNPNDYDDEDRESVEVHQPDLKTTKDDGGRQFRAGQPFDYTISIKNQGRATALQVTVTDDISNFLAKGFTFVGGTHGAALAPSGEVSFRLPDIPVGGTVNVTLTLRTPAAVPAGLEVMTNEATANHLDVEPSPKDNTDDEDTRINAVPDLVVTKDDGLITANVGDEVTYWIHFENVGTQVASGVVVRDTLPPGVDFISASDGGRLVGNTIVWKIDELRPGESGDFSIKVEVRTAGLKVNVVTIEDDGRGGPDPTPKNNRDTDETIGEVGLRFDLNQPIGFGPKSEFGNALRGPGGSLSPFANRFGVRDQLNLFSFFRETEWPETILVPTHMHSGLAQPGSTITLELYDAQGRLIAENSVVADTGGNWLATFPMHSFEEPPSRIVMKQTWATHHNGADTGYNFRTYFAPLSTNGIYAEDLNVYNVTGKRMPTEVLDLYESCVAILTLDWNGQAYEYHALSAQPTGQGR